VINKPANCLPTSRVGVTSPSPTIEISALNTSLFWTFLDFYEIALAPIIKTSTAGVGWLGSVTKQGLNSHKFEKTGGELTGKR
jgi:hypothetical protein